MAHRSIRGIALTLLLTYALGAIGCAPAEPIPPPAASPAPETSFNDQLRAVQSGSSTSIQLDRQVVSDADFTKLSTAAGLTELKLAKAHISDASLAALVDLPLATLVLGEAPITDAGLEQLPTSIKILNLTGAQVTDAGLAHLRRLPRLELLRLGSAKVTDAGLEQIARLPGLRFLILVGTPITDAGLDHVERLSQLESLYLEGTAVTDAGLSKLKQARPDLHIHW
jgi:hypothetical protein